MRNIYGLIEYLQYEYMILAICFLGGTQTIVVPGTRYLVLFTEVSVLYRKGSRGERGISINSRKHEACKRPPMIGGGSAIPSFFRSVSRSARVRYRWKIRTTSGQQQRYACAVRGSLLSSELCVVYTTIISVVLFFML